MSNEQLISQAVDCLTVVIESDESHESVKALCERARDQTLAALRFVRIERINQDERVSA